MKHLYNKPVNFIEQVLRLWPANLGLGFHCDDPDCRSPGDEIKNSGFNRLNCFICDYDICMACANRKICEKQRGNITDTYTILGKI